jgi:hypothetical protein
LVPDACRDRNNNNIVIGFAHSSVQTTSAEFTEKEKRLYALIESLTRLCSSVEFGRGAGKGESRRKPRRTKEAVLNNKARVEPGAKSLVREPSGPRPALRVWRERTHAQRPETGGCPSNTPPRKRLPQFNPYATRRE